MTTHPYLPSEMQPSPMIAQLLLSAPKSRRLDLAVASLLCQVSTEYVLVEEQGHQHSEPIWLFTRNSQRYAYSPSADALSTYRSFPRAESVPFYSLLEKECQSVMRWASTTEMQTYQIRYQTSGNHTQVQVRLRSVYASTAFGMWDEQRRGTRRDAWGTSSQYNETLLTSSSAYMLRPCYEREAETTEIEKEQVICCLICLVTLDAHAPTLVPLLTSDEPPEPAFPKSFLEYTRPRHAQEVILAPHWLARSPYSEPACMYRTYHAGEEDWRCCQAAERRTVEEQCPGCGGYYCDRHFSDVAYDFDDPPGGLFSSSSSQRLRVCVLCAVLSEQEIRHLRAVRLTLGRL